MNAVQRRRRSSSRSSSESEPVISRRDSKSSRHRKHRNDKKHKDRERQRSKSATSDSDDCKSKKSSKKKSKKNRKLSPSSGSDDGSEPVVKKLEQDGEKKKADRAKQKELMKALETPEEKRLRRLMKKEAKEKKRKERMGWDKDYMHYTNTDNPFGDANLLETFVWGKKLDKEGLGSMQQEELERRNKLKQEENRLELEKVKKRRLEREQERARREDELQQLQRQKEAAQFKEWEKQEDTFHLQQAKLRSKIRIQDGRAKPIDLLAKYISTEDEDLAVEMHEPYMYLNGLTIQDLEDLLEDIKVYMELEKSKNLDYWNDITVIVEDELNKLRKVDRSSREHFGDRREGVHVSVSSDVASVFKSKTLAQLAAMHDQIVQKIHSGEEGVDVGYWESLMSQLKAHIARARLRDRHQENLRRKLFQLKQEQGVESEPLFPAAETSGASAVPAPLPAAAPAPPVQETEKPQKSEDAEPVVTEEELLLMSLNEFETGGYNPRLLQPDALEPGTLLTNPNDDAKRLEFARRQLIGTGSVQSALTTEERAFEREAIKGMSDDEALFNVEAALDQKTYLWSDKYRPRKPRYFNRVHTGFEWNKYNQTHYDMDNPPPKIVQGYKFNIFYPDLIDKFITPEYTLTPSPDNKDFAILRFHAGPPYEDIAFKIVNREWEYSYKRGFRCQFHNNIFQLWFHFKRYRYRR